MLSQSILGKIYTAWTQSWIFSLLQRIYRFLIRLLNGSAILEHLFNEGRLESLYHDSLAARIIRFVCRIVNRFLSLFSFLADAADSSFILRLFRGSMLRFVTRFEGLFGAFLFVMFVIPHNSWNNLYAVAAAAVFLVFYAFLVASGRRKFISPETLGLGALLFVIALVLSLGFSYVRRDSFRILLFFFASIAMCYIVSTDFRSPEKLHRLLGWIYAALMVISLYGIAQNVLGLVDENSSYTDILLNQGVPGRVYSTLSNPINLSEFILLFMPLSAAFAGGAKKTWLRVLLALGLVFPAVALLMTYSRGGWLAIVLAAAVFTFCCNKKVIPALIVVLLLFIPLLPESVMIRLSTIGNKADTSTKHRFDIWRGVVRMLRDNFRIFTGIGLGPKTFALIYPSYSVGAAKVGAYHTQLHYLELIVETGLLGLVSFLYMMFKYLGRAGHSMRSVGRQNRLVLIACVSSLVAVAFVGLVEYVWFYPRIMFGFFVFLGILLAAASPGQELKR